MLNLAIYNCSDKVYVIHNKVYPLSDRTVSKPVKTKLFFHHLVLLSDNQRTVVVIYCENYLRGTRK